MLGLSRTYDLRLWCLTAAAAGRSRASEPLRFQGVAVQPRYRTSLPQHRDSTGYVKEHAQVRLAARVFRLARVRATRAGSPRRRGAIHRCRVRANPCQRPRKKLQVVEITAKLFFRGFGTEATMRNDYDQGQALDIKAKTPIVKECEACQVTKFVTADRTSE